MEEITKLIQNYGITTSENFYQQTTQSNDSYYTIEPTTSITNNNITNITPNLSQNSIFQKKPLYRKELVIAKIIISELVACENGKVSAGDRLDQCQDCIR